METKANQSGSWQIAGAALGNQALLLEKRQAAGRALAAAFSQKSLQGRRARRPGAWAARGRHPSPPRASGPAAPGSARLGQGGAQAGQR